MKLVFSEAKADYGHYIFPYAVWAFPETGETPADIFDQGFLPSSRNLDRFYLARHVRVVLPKYRASSENRRILRKGSGISARLIPREEFEYTARRREFYKSYADIKFGRDVMTYERLDFLFEGKITSDVLLFTDTKSGVEIGTVTLFLQPKQMAYYYYAFYDLNYYSRNLGMFMMTFAAGLFRDAGYQYLYLGSCYLDTALYKTQFKGAQFFNGYQWSENLAELKYLIQRGQREQTGHLLETEEYREAFCDADLGDIADRSPFRSGGGGG